MRSLLSLPLLFLIGANLLPLAGVFFWGWDAFVLLILYWLETAIIGFWTALRIIINPSTIDVNGRPMNQMGLGGRIGLALFIAVHAGIFMAVHLVFLWGLFSGDWSGRIHGIGDFVRELIIGTDLWIPLALLFVVRGWLVLSPPVRRRWSVAGEDEGGVIAGGDNFIVDLYLRIFVMQATIIIGAWFALMAGSSTAALALLVVLKTAAEVSYDAIMRQVAKEQAKVERELTGADD